MKHPRRIRLESERARFARALDGCEKHLSSLEKEIETMRRALAGAVPTAKIFFKYVRCGSPRCHCEKGDGHGPYAYQSIRRGRRVETRYLGRKPKLPQGSFDQSQYNRLHQQLKQLRAKRERIYDQIARALQLLQRSR